MSSNKKDFSASAVPVYSAQRGIRATDTKWLTAVQSSSGVETKDKTLQRACTLTTDKLEPAPRLLGPVDPWANFDEIRRNRNRKKKYALNPSIPSYLSANRQLRNYKWLPEKIWDADSWLNAMPKKFDDQPLAMGFDEILSMSIDEPEFFQQETEASEIQTAEQRLKVDMAPKLCDLHQCDGTSTCSINCQRHIFW